MKTARFCISLAAVIVACFLAAASMAQGSDVRESLFKDANEVFQATKMAKADIPALTSYGKATEYNRRASDRFKRSRSIDGIRKKLGKSQARLQVAREAAKIPEVTLSSSIKARSAVSARRRSSRPSYGSGRSKYSPKRRSASRRAASKRRHR